MNRLIEYQRRYIKHTRIVLTLIILLIITSFISLTIGYASISWDKILKIIFNEIPFLNELVINNNFTEGEKVIITEIRLPRIVASILVGMGLSNAGVIFQGIFKNPMADPYVIGVSSGAAFGAALAIVLGIGFQFFGFSTISIMSFILALVTVFVVYNISKIRGEVQTLTLLLSGIAVSIFLSAAISILQVKAGVELHRLVFWLMGSFSVVKWSEVWSVFPFICVGLISTLFFARDLNIITLSTKEAQHLGVDIERTKMILIVIGSLVTAASVSISGLIGFVGLIIPHITRMLVGPDHRILITSSILLGAAFLTFCDSIARVIFIPSDLPVGIITALFGGPFFIYLLRTKRGNTRFREGKSWFS
jgi:iron complex transport system permease protein